MYGNARQCSQRRGKRTVQAESGVEMCAAKQTNLLLLGHDQHNIDVLPHTRVLQPLYGHQRGAPVRLVRRIEGVRESPAQAIRTSYVLPLCECRIHGVLLCCVRQGVEDGEGVVRGSRACEDTRYRRGGVMHSLTHHCEGSYKETTT